ncbi:MAG: SMC family ATPase [Sphaerobacter sp.]|nr:SMC family ATPase [Sphaerobacter sp.]
MIPAFLSLRNFMCYREPVEIDFRGIRVACLSGDNGAGKSALLDAITWALWGKARVNSDRDLIALGASDMEVTFGFILGEQEFRVTRRRRARATSAASLELVACDGDRCRSLTGASLRETQQTIDRLLRMDYDTFINSAFILQGRADEFTTKTPALRKQVLGDILNLNEYDRYEELARQELRERERRLRELDQQLLDLDQQLAELPRYREAVDALGREIVQLTDQVDALRQRLEAVHERLRALEFTASQREIVRRRRAELDAAIADLERRQVQLHQQIEAHRAILARRDTIEAGYRELVELRQRESDLTERLSARQDLIERRRAIEQAIQQATHRLETEIHAVSCQIDERRTQVAEKPEVTARLAAVAAELAELSSVTAQIAELHAAQAAREARRGELQAENKRLRADMEAIKAKLDQVVAADARCPVCRRELGDDERERLRAEYTAEGTALGDRYRANAAAIKQLEAEAAAASAQLQELERRRRRAEALERTAAALQERQDRIARAEAELEQLQALLAGLRDQLARGVPGAEQRPALAELDRALAELPYDRDEHQAIRARIAALRTIEEERRHLDIAQTALERDGAQLETLSLQLTQLHADRAAAEAEEAALAEQLTLLEPLRAERDTLQAELEAVERRRGEAQARFGAAEQRLNDCLRLQDVREERLAERRRVAEEKAIYDELTLAFGKRGVQAMIIENVIPELQQEANAILDKMPGNTMRIEFRTQKQTVRGDNTIETLDIVIGDEAGRRAYELYSGGEAFRANFAIRVALSTLLARRAGTRLQTLVIDEGFGTQDSRGRDGLIEAIRAIERDFQTILVITHISELKDLFPTRIEVRKTPSGSQVQVV